MSEVGQRAKAGIVILGILAGLALVILPGIVAPSTVTPSADGSTIKALSLTPSTGSQASQSAGGNLQAVAIGLLLIVIPAGAFSLYVRRWATHRAKTFWPETEC